MADATETAAILSRAPVVAVLTIDDFELAVPLARVPLLQIRFCATGGIDRGKAREASGLRG